MLRLAMNPASGNVSNRSSRVVMMLKTTPSMARPGAATRCRTEDKDKRPSKIRQTKAALETEAKAEAAETRDRGGPAGLRRELRRLPFVRGTIARRRAS